MVSTDDKLPRITVIVPVRNQATRVRECLEALKRTDYPKDRLEILVVDGESQDGTREIAEQSSSKEFVVRVLGNPMRTRGAALNVGIAQSDGEIIACIDARNLTPPDYLRACVKTIEETGADNVGGVMVPEIVTTTQEAVGLATTHPFGVGYGPYRMATKSGFVDTVYLGCFRRSIFERVGAWDERPDISEDSDMNLRIQQAGGRIYQNAEIRMPYRGRDSLGILVPRFWRSGIQRVGTLLKHGKLTSPRQAVPPLFLCALVVLAVLSFIEGSALGIMVALLGIYAGADFLVSAKLALARGKPALFPKLFIAFPTIHFSNAAAFVWRLVWRPTSDGYLEN
jgi:succinoglycan biosynthesis protein ExoA